MSLYTNTHRNARISPTKVRVIANMIQGMPVEKALIALETNTRRGAALLHKALRAAIANADAAEANVRRLVVAEARVDSGPTIKRFQPKDRGRAHDILKRSSHITVSVSEGTPKKKLSPAKKIKAAAAKKAAPKVAVKAAAK